MTDYNCSSFGAGTKKENSTMQDGTILDQDYYTICKPTERLNRAKAIRQKCLDCCGYQSAEVRLCTSYSCPLWRYRMGKEERDDLYFKAHPLMD